ncbi:diguanylate cyclase (GGDEF) domain-containing protein [Fervidobacterium changbaicum]|uniref:GGDEF domain-containing protein n=1 Tax=Fervidobacterium changbaicum TaxID=310769 RepID=A0ABX5QQD4_9BACT|nr:GGDEF domain-containing protein [Fervidobacterium changbaicum]QAV32660.1 GGDEF domain-containing protein [Fervidobacterium changbaicum]SDH43109.1 diguanylate cyclase (GGDEF) domain-containing protein [Fervidobacterium changbaicum]
MILPSEAEISVLFRYSGEKHIAECINEEIRLRELTDEEREKLIEAILRIARFVLLGNIPPFPAFSVFDVFTFAGEFFFKPPVLFKYDFYKTLYHDVLSRENSEIGKYIFIDKEYLKKGQYDKYSTLRILANFIEIFDIANKYATIISRMRDGTIRVDELEKDRLDEKVLFALVSEIEQRCDSSAQEGKKYLEILVDTSSYYRLFKDYVARIDRYLADRGRTLLYIGDDFTNIARQILWKNREKFSTVEFSELIKCLYISCKFDTIITELLKIFRTLSPLVVVVKDTVEPHYLIRRFLEILKHSEIKTVVLAFKSINPDMVVSVPTANITLPVLPFEELKTKLSELKDGEVLIRALGLEFSRDDVLLFSRVTGKDGESILKNLMKEKIVRSDDGEYVVNIDPKLGDLLLGDEKRETSNELKQLHEAMAQEYRKMISPYSHSSFKAAWHYLLAGKEIAAIVEYLRFVRNAMDRYTFSPSVLSDILQRAYSVLEKNGRTDSYAFHRIKLELEYRIGVRLNFTKANLPDKIIYDYLRVLDIFLEERYHDCIEYAEKILKHQNLTKYKFLKLALIKERAHVNYYDKLSDKVISVEEIQKLPILNTKWAELKAEWLWQIGNALSHTNPEKSINYLREALEISREYDLKHLLVRILNSFGISYDGYLLSIVYFKEAIRIAGEIGYVHYNLSPRMNLARELLYFGRFGELLNELKSMEDLSIGYRSPSNTAFLYRLYGMFHSYLRHYEKGWEYINKALLVEKENDLPHSSLRAMILHEMLCGKKENARELIEKYRDDPAIHTRAFEYLVRMIIARDDEEFFRAWSEYVSSPYTLLREEILYLFTDQIFRVDKGKLEEELNKWDSFYTSEMTKLSLLYVLLAKLRYYELIRNELKYNMTKLRLMKLIKQLGIEDDFREFLDEDLEPQVDNILTGYEIIETLEILRSLDQRVNLDEFLRIFSNIIISIFRTQSVFISVTDKRVNLSSTIGFLPQNKQTNIVKLDPLEVGISGSIDEYSEYIIYLAGNFSIKKESEVEEFWNKLTLLDELFSNQLKGIIYRERAMRDSLTGLYNRWRFTQILKEYLEEPQVKLKQKEISVFMADIDDFKKINDNYGHMKGDEVLRNVAKILQEEVEGFGIVARYGGEEFVGVLEAEKNKCLEVCENIRRRLEMASESIFGFRVTLSFGISSSLERSTITEILGLADQRLYKAKEMGKNRVCIE